MLRDAITYLSCEIERFGGFPVRHDVGVAQLHEKALPIRKSVAALEKDGVTYVHAVVDEEWHAGCFCNLMKLLCYADEIGGF